MGFLRFAGAAMFAALIVLWADRVGGSLLPGPHLASVRYFAFKLFHWACMFGAVMLVTPARRYWATALMCALALTVASYMAMTLVAASNVFSFQLHLYWIAVLAVFALPLWPIWRWYDRLVRALGS
jgi:hypothetical protein